MPAGVVVSGIEKLEVTWDAFTDAIITADDFAGLKEVTASTAKVGNLGNLTVNGAGAITVTAGEGMKGNLVVNDVTTGVVNAGAAKTVTVDAKASADTDDTVTVTAGATTTAIEVGTTASFDSATVTASAVTTDIEVEADKTVTVTAGAATKNITTTSAAATIDATAAVKDAVVTVNGFGAADVATVTLGNDATVTSNLTGTEKLTLDVADGKVVTLATVATTADTVEVKGAGAVTVKGTATNLTLDTITKSNTGTLTVAISDAAATGTINTAKFGADLITLTAGTAPVIVAKTGQSFEVAASAATSKIEVGVATDTAADALSLKLTSSRYAEVKNTAATDAETLTITAAAAQAASPTITDLTIDDLVAGAGNKVVLNGTNDVELTLVTSAKEIDASALNGELVVKNTAATVASLTIAGATGKNDITFNPAALTTGVFIGQGSDDTVDFGTIIAGATITAVTGAGKDTVTVDATALLTGAGAVSIETGAGDDTVELTSVAATTGTIVLQFGDGNDTLKLAAAADLTAANLTLTGLEKVVVNGTADFTGAQMTGRTLLVEGTTASAVDTINVTATVATGETIDLSGLTGTDSVTTGIKGALLTGDAGKDVLIGTNRDDTIDGKADADQMTGGAGADTFVIDSDGAATAAVADVVTDFSLSAGDKLDFGTAYSATTDKYAEGTAAVADYAAALAAANVIFNASTDTSFVAQQVGSDTYVFFGAAAGTSATDVVKLVGVALTDIDATAIA